MKLADRIVRLTFFIALLWMIAVIFGFADWPFDDGKYFAFAFFALGFLASIFWAIFDNRSTSKSQQTGDESPPWVD